MCEKVHYFCVFFPPFIIYNMSSALTIYKNGLIAAARVNYNTALTALAVRYQALIDAVKQNTVFSLRWKTNEISKLVRARSKELTILKNAYNKEVIDIKKITKVPRGPGTIKQAVFIGINYKGTSSRLNGCINDTVLVSNLLKDKFGYSASNISFLTDDTVIKPTRKNILDAFKTLLVDSLPGDSLFFFYSGHGKQKSNPSNPNPLDKIDECIYSIDGKTITDIELKNLVDVNLKEGVTLTTIFDSCFSGTIMNLKYNYLNGLDDNTLVIDTYTAPTLGNLICISGSKDNQTSEDDWINGQYNGPPTWARTTDQLINSQLLYH